MAGWQEELAELLGELGVTQEEETQTTHRSTVKPMRSDVRWRLRPGYMGKHQADTFETENESDDAGAWLTDLTAMRREVDAIVQQVIQLMQRGDLDQSLKDDVMIVLRALRRRSAVTQQAETGDEAYLESVSAMLHFCRVILSLSETTIEDL